MITNALTALRGSFAAALLATALSASAQEAAAPPPATPAAPADAPAPAPKPEEKPAIKIGAFVHADGRLFLDDDAKKLTDDLLIRRARADFQGKLGRFAGRIVI